MKNPILQKTLIFKNESFEILSMSVLSIAFLFIANGCSPEAPTHSSASSQNTPKKANVADVQKGAQTANGDAVKDSSVRKEQMLVTALETATTKIKTRIAGREQNLQRERDRTGKLGVELLGDSAAGCFARQKIEKFELLVQGDHLPFSPTKSTREFEGPPASQDSPMQIQISLGDEFTVTVSNEEVSPLFGPSGKILSTEYKNNRIADITGIKFKKGGIGFQVNKRCFSKGLFSSACVWDYNETNRYRLDKVTIKANDEVVYRKEGINVIFEGDKRLWQDDNFESNEDFLKLMGRNDCQQKQ